MRRAAGNRARETFGVSICRLAVSALAVASALLALPVAVSADQGGSTIASAPELPLDRSVASIVSASATLGKACATEGRSGEFWRVSMGALDEIVVDFGSANGDLVGINMLAPSVTDATLADAEDTHDCLSLDTTSTKARLEYEAFRGSGRYTMLVTDRQGTKDLNYYLIARLLHYTRLAITVPTLARARTQVTFKGVVTGASQGAVTMQWQIGADARWRTIARVRLSDAGRFSVKARPVAPGLYRVRASYPGDNSHLPSLANASLKVTR